MPTSEIEKYMKKYPEIELKTLECYPLSIIQVINEVDDLLKA